MWKSSSCGWQIIFQEELLIVISPEPGRCECCDLWSWYPRLSSPRSSPGVTQTRTQTRDSSVLAWPRSAGARTEPRARVESIKPFLRSDQNTVWRRYFIQTGQVTRENCHITYYAMSYHCQISLIKPQWWMGPDKQISWQHIVTLWRNNVDKLIFYCENFLEFILFTWLSDNLLLRAINKLINSQQYPVTRFLYLALLTFVRGIFDQNDLILQFLSVIEFSYFTFAKVC